MSVPRKPVADNTYETKVLFYERLYYKENILVPKEKSNLIDLWSPIYRDYGSVDLENQRIRLDTRFLKELEGSKKDETVHAINFIADAWNDLRQYCISAGDRPGVPVIHPNSLYTDIKPTTQNQWEPLKNSYHDHLRTVFDPFVAGYLQFHKYKKRVRNIKDFLEMFLQFAETLKAKIPLTKTGFTESMYGPVNHNGIMIEINESKLHDNDGAKWSFINDNGFQFWLRGCAMHGFLVDRNAPWRIVANLESRKMLRYAKEYGVHTLRQIFDTYFVRTHQDDIRELKNFIYMFYRGYLRFEPYFVENELLVNHKRTVSTKVWRGDVNKNAFFEKYNDLYWMRYWFLLRTHELGVTFTAHQQQDVLKTAYKIEKDLDIDSAMSYIVRVLRKKAGLGGPPEKSFLRREGDRQMIVRT